MFAVSGRDPLSPRPAEQIALSHQPQHLLVIDDKLFVLKLLGHPAVTVAGELQADGFNAAGDVGILSGRTSFTPVVKCAPGDVHETAPPPDTADEVLPLADDFPFL